MGTVFGVIGIITLIALGAMSIIFTTGKRGD